MTEYWTEFVQESHERITQLNNALLTLERNPDDEDAIENIFGSPTRSKATAVRPGSSRQVTSHTA